MHVGSHAPNRKRQATVTFTGRSRIVCVQYGTCFVSPFWRLEIAVGSQIFGDFMDPRSNHHTDSAVSNSKPPFHHVLQKFKITGNSRHLL